MDLVEFWQVIQPEYTVREANHEKIGGGMESGTVNFGIILQEEILLDNSPPSLCNILLRFWVFLGYVLPTKNGTILAHGVNL